MTQAQDLMLEAARCRRLAENNMDVKAAAALYEVAVMYEARAFDEPADPPPPPTADGA